MLGWEASHEESCSPDMDERKVKVTQQERKAGGIDWLDETYSKESVSKELYRVKKLCKKAGSSRKASTPTQDQNQHVAGVNQGENKIGKKHYCIFCALKEM